jgi:N4-(beta-N-acetylglucosaminyl)-L-asparaginase
MRNGASPQEAVEETIKRIIKKTPDFEQHQVGFLAVNKSGSVGAYAIQPGFNFALHSSESNILIDSASYLD